jgi:hypothetical protein
MTRFEPAAIFAITTSFGNPVMLRLGTSPTLHGMKGCHGSSQAAPMGACSGDCLERTHACRSARRTSPPLAWIQLETFARPSLPRSLRLALSSP